MPSLSSSQSSRRLESKFECQLGRDVRAHSREEHLLPLPVDARPHGIPARKGRPVGLRPGRCQRALLATGPQVAPAAGLPPGGGQGRGWEVRAGAGAGQLCQPSMAKRGASPSVSGLLGHPRYDSSARPGDGSPVAGSGHSARARQTCAPLPGPTACEGRACMGTRAPPGIARMSAGAGSGGAGGQGLGARQGTGAWQMAAATCARLASSCAAVRAEV